MTKSSPSAHEVEMALSVKQRLIDRLKVILFLMVEVDVPWPKKGVWLGYSDQWNDSDFKIAIPTPQFQSVAEFNYSVLLQDGFFEIVIAQKVGSDELLFGVVVDDVLVRAPASDLVEMLLAETDDPSEFGRQTENVATIVQTLNNIVL